MNDLEHQIQTGIVHYLRLRGYLVLAVPNGGARDFRTGRRLKDEGVLAGVSDLIVIQAGKVCFVEVKTPTGRQSDSQKEFQKSVEAKGYEYLIWRSIKDAIKWTESL